MNRCVSKMKSKSIIDSETTEEIYKWIGFCIDKQMDRIVIGWINWWMKNKTDERTIKRRNEKSNESKSEWMNEALVEYIHIQMNE